LIILDENILDGQRQLIEKAGLAVRQVGYDFLSKGIKDDQIIVHLRALRRPTFITRDTDFFRKTLCHRSYCLVVVSAMQYEVAGLARRFLRHPSFDTQVKRLGRVVRIAPTGIVVWTLHSRFEMTQRWSQG
jgi:hypothetical protein